MEVTYYEDEGGQKYKRDAKQKKVFLKTPDGEKEIPNTTRPYRAAVAYGAKISEQEYQAS